MSSPNSISSFHLIWFVEELCPDSWFFWMDWKSVTTLISLFWELVGYLLRFPSHVERFEQIVWSWVMYSRVRVWISWYRRASERGSSTSLWALSRPIQTLTWVLVGRPMWVYQRNNVLMLFIHHWFSCRRFLSRLLRKFLATGSKSYNLSPRSFIVIHFPRPTV